MCREGHTFVVWLKLGEFLLRSVEPISESGRPLPLVGEAVGVLFMRSGDTCAHCHEHAIDGGRDEMIKNLHLHCATWWRAWLLSMQRGSLRRRGMFAKNGGIPWERMHR